MIRRMKKGLVAAGVICLLAAAPWGGFDAYAASARIAFSDPSTTVGQEFTVTVKITAQDGSLGVSDMMLSYDPSVIEFVSGTNASGGAGSIRLVSTMDSSSTTEFQYTLKFKAVQAGNTTISVGNYEIYDADSQTVSVSKVGSSAVKVNAPSTYSSEAGLASLKVSPGQLSPAFSSDVTSYTVQVGVDVEKLAVSAEAKDSKAKVVVSGNSDLQVGQNNVQCKVTAEDGQTSKTYAITVVKSESAEVPAEEGVTAGEVSLGGQTVEMDGISYTVASSFDASMLPEGYTQASCSYGGTEVMCGSGNGLTLLYLQAADGTGDFFIYVPETGAMSPFVTIDVSAKSILVLPVDDTVEIPNGFVQTTIQLNGDKKVQGWVWQSDEEQRYCVVYGMNAEGEKGLYRFDIGEKTFQRYFEDPALQSKYDDAWVEEVVNLYNSLRKDYGILSIVLWVLVAVCLILFFAVINMLLGRKHRKGSAAPARQSKQGTAGRVQAAPQRAQDTRSAERDGYAGTSSQRARDTRPTERDGYAGASSQRAQDTRSAERDGYARASSQRVRDTREEAQSGRAGASSRQPQNVRQAERNGRSDTVVREAAAGRTQTAPRRTGETGRSVSVRQTDRARRPVSYDLGASDFYGSGSDRNPSRWSREDGMDEALRLKEQEREERARRIRERLERERLEDERRARAGRSGYGQSGYGQNSYSQSSYDQNSYGQNSYGQGRTRTEAGSQSAAAQRRMAGSGTGAEHRRTETKPAGRTERPASGSGAARSAESLKRSERAESPVRRPLRPVSREDDFEVFDL